MTQEFIEEIEGLSRKFSAKEREEGDDTIQKARHMIMGVFQGMKNGENQSDLMRQLRESKGRGLKDLEDIFHAFFTEKTEGVQSARRAIGKINIKRIPVDKAQD